MKRNIQLLDLKKIEEAPRRSWLFRKMRPVLNVGDVVTFDLALERIASPSQEMAGAIVILEIE